MLFKYNLLLTVQNTLSDTEQFALKVLNAFFEKILEKITCVLDMKANISMFTLFKSQRDNQYSSNRENMNSYNLFYSVLFAL